MKKILCVSVVLFLLVSSIVFAGEIHIGGVNIDGHQYGGIHSDSGRINGPIHVEERFGTGNGGDHSYQQPYPQNTGREMINNNIVINEDDTRENARTPIIIVLQNIYKTTGQCGVYKTPSIFDPQGEVFVGKLRMEETYSPSVYCLVESFWNGTLEGGVSFRNIQKEWKLVIRDDGGLDLQEKR